MDDPAVLLQSLKNRDVGELFDISPLSGGINSQTWRLNTARGDFVAKFAFDAASFEAGLEIAEQLQLAGLSAGRPIRTRKGSLIIPSPQGALGVLAFNSGTALDLAQAAAMHKWETTMARLHTALLRLRRVPPGIRRWPWRWLDYTADHVRARPWLQNVLISVLSEAEHLTTVRDLTLGIIHGDGAAVIADSSTNRLSVIDWGAVMWGPLLYDIAAAYWLSIIERRCDPLVFQPFAQAYREEGPLSSAEFAYLKLFVRLRGVVLAFYFAWRCDYNVQTGLSGSHDNEHRLKHVREEMSFIS